MQDTIKNGTLLRTLILSIALIGIVTISLMKTTMAPKAQLASPKLIGEETSSL